MRQRVPEPRGAPCPNRPHLLINGLSVGTGGGFTVAQELFRNIAVSQPDWRVTMALIEGHALHREMLDDRGLPPNCNFMLAPPDAMDRVRRARYERSDLVRWAERERATGVLQLNGMIVPGMPAPTLAHFQDPWPYRPEAWTRSPFDPLLAWTKRRENRAALIGAAAAGWTSAYLRDLITQRHHIHPSRSVVYYNGVPEAWIEGLGHDVVPWEERPMEIVSISNVNPYKRQSLVIEAMPELLARPGLGGLRYTIAGKIAPAYREELQAKIDRLGLSDRVKIEGRVSPERVVELFRNARAFVLMSVCESFGIPAVEAMCHGTPAVVADCCAIPEVCGDAGVRVRPDDRSGLVEAGYSNVRRFSWRSIGDAMAADLATVMGVGEPAVAAA